jgi:hypothetical protein
MKSLVAILLLINCLAFFMFKHMQKQSELNNEQAKMGQAQVNSPLTIKLLSELSADQLEALDLEPLHPEPLDSEPLDSESLEPVNLENESVEVDVVPAP